MESLLLISRLLLAVVFAVAGVAKLLDLSGSRQAMRNFGVPARLAGIAGVALPIAEITVAVALVPPVTAWWGAAGATLLLAGFLAGIGVNLAKGRTPDCHCFGQLHSEPIGRATLVRNGVLAALALLTLAGGLDQPGYGLTSWLGDPSVPGPVLAAILAAQSILILFACWLTLHLLTQNGRLLLRLEALEAQRVAPQPSTKPSPIVRGLPVGSVAPDFTLDDLDGQPVSLADLRQAGNPVLAVFTDPHCGPCNALLPDIARWQRDLTGTMTVTMVAGGTADDNRRKIGDLRLNRILVDPGRSIGRQYGSTGTPGAVIILPDGTIGSPLAAGTEEIRRLVPANTPARLPAVGSPAPAFSLPSLDGKLRTLADFPERERVLLFWNPACGFCQRMAEGLRSWLANRPKDAPDLVLISTGSPEANRAMGIDATILLDENFATGRAFGARGTPAAIRIAADGTIASRVVVGGPAIMSELDAGRTNTSLAS